MSYEIIKLYYYLEILSAAILRSTSTGTSVHRIFSFAAKGGWPCLHHARFTEPLHSCRRGHSAFVQTEHLPPGPFCPMGCALEEDGKVKVKLDAITAWDNVLVFCWLGGGTGRNDGLGWSLLFTGELGTFSHPPALSVINNLDWSCSLIGVTSSKCTWMGCAASAVPMAVRSPSNSSSSKKSSVIYKGQIWWERFIILYTYLTRYSSDQGVTVHAKLLCC